MSTSPDHPRLPLVMLPSGEAVPALGQGTWFMGESRGTRRSEADALRLGIDLGMTLIDTAEMYADGGAEEIVADAISGRRDGVFLVSKVLPGNAGRRSTLAACERSLARLRTDRIDLYLLHWRGSIPLGETVEALERLREVGKIRHWGVSNLDRADLEELRRLTRGAACAADQILYNLARRGPEWDLLPACRAQHLPVMAYSPIEQGRLLRQPALMQLAGRHGATPAQVALAWLLRQGDVIAIPKAADPRHVRENRAAAAIALDEDDLQELDRAFPPPDGPSPLEML